MVKEKTRPSSNSENVTNVKELILYNDNFHSFEEVINALIDVCKHPPDQAEQCAYITHLKGSCAVKAGRMSELKPLCAELLTRGLTAEIE